MHLPLTLPHVPDELEFMTLCEDPIRKTFIFPFKYKAYTLKKRFLWIYLKQPSGEKPTESAFFRGGKTWKAIG